MCRAIEKVKLRVRKESAGKKRTQTQGELKQGQLIAQKLFYPPPMYQVLSPENKVASLDHPPFLLSNKDICSSNKGDGMM
jgi:hypothetical protein